MSEVKDDSDDLSVGMKKVSFVDPVPSSPLPPASNPTTAAASATSPAPISLDKGWPDQDVVGLDLSSLTPLSPIVMHRQATINIGTIGHVAHGKSTVVKAISGVQTVRFKTELERNITIKLGYANAKIYRCDNLRCPRPGNYKSYGSAMEAAPTCDRPACGGRMVLQRHVSFVDCFGPDVMFATPTGVIANKDIVQGTALLGPDGEARIVGAIEDGTKKMYRVEFVDQSKDAGRLEQSSFTCTGGHLLCLRIDTPVDAVVWDGIKSKYFVKHFIVKNDLIASTKVWFDSREGADEYYEEADKAPVKFTMTVESYLASAATVRTKARMYRADAFEFDGDKVDLALGSATAEEVAWLIGLWLGDGDAIQPRFTLSASGDGDIKARLAALAPKLGLVAVTKEYKKRDAVWVSLSTASGPACGTVAATNVMANNKFQQLLAALGLLSNKGVPKALLDQSKEVRAAVVAGFFDADGSYGGGQFDLEQSAATHAALFVGFVRLVRSIGFVAHVSSRTVTVHGKVHKKLRVRFNGATPLPIATVAKRGGVSSRAWATSAPLKITPIGVGPYRKWSVAGSDEFVLLESFVVAHNCPGHDILMATMLNGAAVMDAAMLLIAGNEPCWPVDDTRILTDRGYLFFEDIKELEQRGEQPLFACYDSKSASLVFRPRIGRLVHYEHNGSIVDFTHTAERPRWAADSTAFGASSHAPSTMHTGGHFTLRVTPEHVVFTQHGEWQGNNQWRWSAFGREQAGAAAPTQSSTAIRMLTRAAGGGTPESDESAVERAVLAMFGVSGTAACDAFLELYGFWLGDGSLDVHNQRVIFINHKEDDVAWLRTTLLKTGLPADAWYENRQKGTGVRFAIGPWFAPFFDEYGDKHTVSTREYSDVRFVADVVPVTTPYHRAPKKSCVCLWCNVHLVNAPAGRSKHRAKCTADLRASAPSSSSAAASSAAASFSSGRPSELEDDASASHSQEGCKENAPSVCKIEAPNVASAKWFWYWLKKASRRQLRLVVAGLHRADGSFSSERGEIYTSSVRFRDELLAVLASAGYTASFSLERQAGAVSSYIGKEGAQGKRTLTPQAFAELPGDQQGQYRAVAAKSCSWRVQFSEYEAVALREADVQSCPFKGAVWCLVVDHPEHLVVVQRAHRVQDGDKWIVTKAGAAVICGQCPQPQTSEHLAAVEIMKLKHLLILQNKIDLVKEKEAASQYDEILNFIRGTVADGSPIIPISAQLKYNIEVPPCLPSLRPALAPSPSLPPSPPPSHSSPSSPSPLVCVRLYASTSARRSRCPCATSRPPLS